MNQLSCTIPDALLAQRPGAVSSRRSPRSHFEEPLSAAALGNSRRWGDAPYPVQREMIGTVIAESRRQGLSEGETALALAVVRAESGFNPDAAAQTSSAAGLGQLIDATAALYGLHDDNRFQPHAAAQAAIAHLRRALQRVDRFAPGLQPTERYARAYGAHHDGLDSAATSGRGRGYRLGLESVVPWVRAFARYLAGCG